MLRFLFLSLFTVAVVTSADVIPGQGSDIPTDSSVQWGQLDNGVRYALMVNNQPKDKVSLRLLVHAGSLMEEDLQSGLAHYLEHLAFNGTTHYPPGTLVTQLQELGLSFGADTNAHTSFDETVYKLDLPDTKPATIATGMRVLADYAGGMLLLDAEIERERGIIMAEMRDRNTASFREMQALYRSLYPGMRIPQRFPIGAPETVNGADRALINRFYTEWYRPERFVVVAVGAIDKAVVEKQIRDTFEMLMPQAPARPVPDKGTLTKQELSICLHQEKESDGTTVSLMHVRQQDLPPDTAAYRRADLVRDIANSIINSRFRKMVAANPEGPVLEASAFSYQWLDLQHAGIQAKVRPGQSLAGLALIEQELRRFQQFGPTASEVKSITARIRTQAEESVAKAANRSNAGLASKLYQAAKLNRVVTTPEQDRDLTLPVLSSVTPDEIKAANTAWWTGGNLLVAVTGADDLGAEGEKQVRAALRASQQVEVTAPAIDAVAQWGYAERPAEPELSAAAQQERKRTTEMFAKRGITMDAIGSVNLVVKRTDYKPNEVLMSVRIGMEPSPRPAGWGELVERAFLAGGLGKHAAEDLADVLAGTSTRLSSPSIDDDSVSFSASCLPKDIELCMQRIVAQITDPGWREEAEKRAKAEWIDALVASETDLNAQVSRRFQNLAVHDAPHRRAATKEEAEQVTFAAVKPWFNNILSRGPLQISIVGDIDEEKTLKLLAPYLAKLGNQRSVLPIHLGPANELVLPKVQPIPSGVHRFAVQGTVRRALLRIAWPTDDAYDVHKNRRLGMLAQVLSERMRIKIREELGDAYSPFSYRFGSDTYEGYGYLLAQVGVAPERVEEARTAVLAIVEDLATNGVAADVLERVKTPVIKSLASARQQNQYWLRSVMSRVIEQPFRLEWADNMEADYAAISAEDLSALAKEYLRNDHALQVIGVCEGKL